MNLHLFRLFALIIYVIFPFVVHSQVQEDFSDGELVTNPCWSGDPDKFTIRKYGTGFFLLDLDDTQKGSAVLTTPSRLIRGTAWNFHFQFNGTARNASSYARFYLSSDSPDLRGNVQGYYVDFGSVEGLVTLVRRDGGLSDTTILIHTKAKMTLGKNSNLEIRVTCSSEGEWKLYADIGNGVYECWGRAVDRTYTQSGYVGIYCVYTQSNRKNFSFGTISVIPLEENTGEEEGEAPAPDDKDTGEEPGKPDEGKEEPDREQDSHATDTRGFYTERNSFSPNGDGIYDELVVCYDLPAKGYEVSMSVFSATGRNIRTLASVYLEPAKGDLVSSPLKWDGKSEQGETAPLGLYIVMLKATHPAASGIVYKRVIALTD